jgi:hypothetical protein
VSGASSSDNSAGLMSHFRKLLGYSTCNERPSTRWEIRYDSVSIMTNGGPVGLL